MTNDTTDKVKQWPCLRRKESLSFPKSKELATQILSPANLNLERKKGLWPLSLASDLEGRDLETDMIRHLTFCGLCQMSQDLSVAAVSGWETSWLACQLSGREKFMPLCLLSSCDWTKNKIDTDRLTGEEETNCNSCARGCFRNGTWRSGQSRQLLYVSYLETIHFWGMDRTNKRKFWGLN